MKPLFNPSHFSPPRPRLCVGAILPRPWFPIPVESRTLFCNFVWPTMNLTFFLVQMATLCSSGKIGIKKCGEHFSKNVILTHCLYHRLLLFSLSPPFVWQFLFSSEDNIVLLSGTALALPPGRARNQTYFKYGNISKNCQKSDIFENISWRKIGVQPDSKCVQTSFQVCSPTFWSDIQGVLHKYVRVN